MKFIDKMEEIDQYMVKNKMDLDFDRWLYLNFMKRLIEDGPLASSQRKLLLHEVIKLQHDIENKEYEVK